MHLVLVHRSTGFGRVSIVGVKHVQEMSVPKCMARTWCGIKLLSAARRTRGKMSSKSHSK
jgi:hypothetical protein